MSAINVDLKRTAERNARAISLRPSVGQGTATTVVRLPAGGTSADIEDGPWRFRCAMAREMGGDESAPDPGNLLRGALGSCMALGYALWAARMDVPIDDVTVTIETDYDARGMYGVDAAVAPGFGGVRCIVHISSPAPAERVREMVEMADRCSPLLDDMSRAVAVERDVRVTAPAKE
jgi:uncharacterized OsmC-like protein